MTDATGSNDTAPVREPDAEAPMAATTPLVGRLERVDARTVLAHEERDFTPWLVAHADYLSDALGIDLELEAAEHRIGPFELDLLGTDVANNAVLIAENQLAPTDHTHLGQLLTYAAGAGAGTIVWIATHFGEQHRQAIDWLNQRTDEETHFFAVEPSPTLRPSDPWLGQRWLLKRLHGGLRCVRLDPKARPLSPRS